METQEKQITPNHYELAVLTNDVTVINTFSPIAASIWQEVVAACGLFKVSNDYLVGKYKVSEIKIGEYIKELVSAGFVGGVWCSSTGMKYKLAK